MIRILHIHMSLLVLALAAVDAMLLYATVDVTLDLSKYGLPAFIDDLPQPSLQKILFPIVTIAALHSMGVYNEKNVGDLRKIAPRLATAFGLTFVLLLVIFYTRPDTRIWMSALLPALFVAPLCLVVARKVFQHLVCANALKARVLVLGAGPCAQKVAEITRGGEARFVCIGFLPFGDPIAVDRRRVILERDLQRACEVLRPDEIVVALEDRRNTLPIESLLECRLRGMQVTAVDSFLERELREIDIDHLNPSWLIFADGSTKGIHSRIAKRVFDVTVSTCFLILTLPLMGLVALAIWLEDGKPIFYSQERAGLYGCVFRILKFRSMRIDAERDGIAQWASRGDPRVTRVGYFIRRTRIDEIPQVLNVLKGEMSFVGPRPERPSIVADIAKEIPYYEYRKLVKPGITGWAQISCGYGDSLGSSRQKLKYDLYYIKNGGLFLDMVILLQTVRVVVWAEGSR